MMAVMQQRVSYSEALGHGMADKRIDILRQIGESGSISQAARTVGVSYKAAWQAIDTLTNLAGVALVERAVGGAGGGGALLTEAGHALLAAAGAMAQARDAVLQRIEEGQGPGQVAVALALRTSMRNQWPCVVQSIDVEGPMARVYLWSTGAGGVAMPITARITTESAELLGLQAGLRVLALCKATAVRVQPLQGMSVEEAGPNCWSGLASRVAAGEAGDEVSATLDVGVQMVGFAPPKSGLLTQARVSLVVEETAVVLALLG
jgi:molybdate transport system regulatory protein